MKIEIKSGLSDVPNFDLADLRKTEAKWIKGKKNNKNKNNNNNNNYNYNNYNNNNNNNNINNEIETSKRKQWARECIRCWACMDIGGARTNERMLMIKESERISEGRIKKKKTAN